MKKSISLILAFALVIGVFAIAPLAPTANATSVEGLTFELNDDEESYYVSKCDTQVSGELTIPDTYNDLPVTRIGIEAFFACGSLTSVTIPSNIKCIGDGAFWMCHILSNVIISNGVTDIGNGAFKNCRSLVSVSIPDTVTNIGEDVFLNCPDEMIFIVDNNDFVISYLEKNKFNYTNNAPLVFKLNEDGQSYSVAGHNITTENKIIIPNTYNGLPVTSIENSAFLACTSLTSVTLPNSIKSIGDNAFFNCSEELTFIIDNNAYLIEYLEKNNLNHTIKLPVVLELNEDGQSYSVVGHNIAIETELVIPSTYNDLPVTSIADHVFEDCIALTSVIIPNSVTSIGDFAFNSCVALTSVTIGDGVTTIGEGAFYYCVALTSISIPNSVTNIGDSAFGYCNNLENVTLENGITSLGILMFEGCRSLTSITIPDSVTTIGAGAFYECIKLTNITIPDKVTSIGEAAFYYCRDLISVALTGSVKSIGDSAFSMCSALKYMFYAASSTDWGNISIGSDNTEFASAKIHYNATGHSHSCSMERAPTEQENGKAIDTCPVCGFINGEEDIVYINNHITAVDTKNAVVDTTSNTLLLDMSACKDINEAIVEMDGYTLTIAPTSSYGFIGTGSKVQVADSTGTQVAEYTLVVRGDVNGDSVCDVLDCMLLELARHESNNVSLEGVYFAAGNLAEDNEINIDDVKAVVNKALALA